MAQLFTLGGDRIGSGQKQKVALHNFEMNSFNLEQDFKSTMAPGILYPFIKMVGTNHGTFDIDVDTFVRTLPTTGPLFGSFKLQIDLYSVAFRLYQGVLHNNPTDIGLNMNQVYLPKLKVKTVDWPDCPKVKGSNQYDYQVNPSALLKYLGMSGFGTNGSYPSYNYIERKFQCVPILAYYDIFKCYYSNKQEEMAYVITPGIVEDARSEIDTITNWDGSDEWSPNEEIPIPTGWTTFPCFIQGTNLSNKNIKVKLNYYKDTSGNTGTISFTLQEILDLQTQEHQGVASWLSSANNQEISPNVILYMDEICALKGITPVTYDDSQFESIIFNDKEQDPEVTADIKLTPFKLKNIDKMRYALLKSNEIGDEFVIGEGGDWTASSGEDETGLPYSTLFKRTTNEGITFNAFAENGLVVKTYQSDLFNNWLDTEFIDGPNGIAAITAVDTSGGSFTMDTLNLAEKFYELLNRIITAGGTYQDWQEAVYGEGTVRMAETPMYIGGMSAEIMFEEVIATTENTDTDQALGSLGGKGTQVGKKGGNNIHVKLDEPGYIIGIASITPRICYSQGNDWDMTELDTLDDLHKPSLDGIGFQPLMIEQMAWWNTVIGGSSILHRYSAGKQTAWINYQTAIDKCYGDFAKQDGYAFMVLNRNYERGGEHRWDVKDVTTYIDPAKYNYAFAYTKLDAQNFWVQIHSKVIARRKMGAQQLPNL